MFQTDPTPPYPVVLHYNFWHVAWKHMNHLDHISGQDLPNAVCLMYQTWRGKKKGSQTWPQNHAIYLTSVKKPKYRWWSYRSSWAFASSSYTHDGLVKSLVGLGDLRSWFSGIPIPKICPIAVGLTNEFVGGCQLSQQQKGIIGK